MDIDELQKEIAEFAAQRNWEQFHSIRNLVLALVGEAGELASVVQWLEGIDKTYLESHSDIREDLSDELADVFIYLLRIADVSGINLKHAVQEKMEKNSKRYTVEKSFGNAEKQ